MLVCLGCTFVSRCTLLLHSSSVHTCAIFAWQAPAKCSISNHSAQPVRACAEWRLHQCRLCTGSIRALDSWQQMALCQEADHTHCVCVLSAAHHMHVSCTWGHSLLYSVRVAWVGAVRGFCYDEMACHHGRLW